MTPTSLTLIIYDDHYDCQCDDYNTDHDDARGSPANTPIYPEWPRFSLKEHGMVYAGHRSTPCVLGVCMFIESRMSQGNVHCLLHTVDTKVKLVP